MSDGLIASVAKLLNPQFDQMLYADQVAYIKAFSYPVRKTAHFLEYAVLGTLSTNLAYQVLEYEERTSKLALTCAPWLFCIAFACTDEFHQLFVDGRSGQFIDVCIDSAGALAGVLLLYVILRRKR